MFLAERPPMPYTVEDAVAFSTAEGRKMHVAVRPYARPHDRTLLVWYSPPPAGEFASLCPSAVK
jgi:hypothetical protein